MHCRVVQQQILDKNGWKDKKAWAFGLGLERLAMVKFAISDIRTFWSEDERFKKQFKAGNLDTVFKPYSKYPPCFKVNSIPLDCISEGKLIFTLQIETKFLCLEAQCKVFQCRQLESDTSQLAFPVVAKTPCSILVLGVQNPDMAYLLEELCLIQ